MIQTSIKKLFSEAEFNELNSYEYFKGVKEIKQVKQGLFVNVQKTYYVAHPGYTLFLNSKKIEETINTEDTTVNTFMKYKGIL